MNTWFAWGTINSDVRMSRAKNGKTVLHTTFSYKGAATEGYQTVKIIAFDKLAENMENFVKRGTRVVLTGELQIGTVNRNGITKPFVQIVVKSFDVLAGFKGIYVDSAATPDGMEEADAIEGDYTE